ncbi:MAG: hypothetical protein ABI667_03825 [Sphingomicrobium sp.]
MIYPDEHANDNHGRSRLSRLIVGVVLILILLLVLTGTVDEVLRFLADFTLRHGG